MSNPNQEFSYYPFKNNKNGKTYYKKYKLKNTRKGRPKLQKNLLKEKLLSSLPLFSEEQLIQLNNILSDENECHNCLTNLINN